ncbi:MAG: Holliday junction resolvase RuvX [Acidobacteriota bacterium]
MRVLGVDVGMRRIGLALSDATGLLASPWKTIEASANPITDAERIASTIVGVDDGVQAIVVGHPRRLDGSPTELTAHVEAVAADLRIRVQVPVILQDERLTSREAEALLAEREKDWRKRKTKLDAAAAAVLLQDYLDSIR